LEASVYSPREHDERSRLEGLREFQILRTPAEGVFDDILRLATLICDTPIGKIGFVDHQQVWLKAKIGLELDEIPRERSFSTSAILRSDILIVPDPLSDPKFANNLLVKDIGVRFFAGVPLITSNQHAIGTLSVMDRVPHLMTAEQIDSLHTLARRTMRELELRRTREAPARHEGIRLAAARATSATVLVVEDDEIIGELLQRTLARVGFAVLTASDGAEALGVCQQHAGPIDLVVSDIVMPRLNGIELSKRVRAARPQTKFLFITGFGDQFPELRESSADIVEKPFLPSELVRKVEDLLDKGKSATGTGG
jgi:CheY-like chemotaxis protein